MGQADTILSMVSKIYGAVLEPDGWNDVLRQLKEVIRVQDAGLLIQRAGSRASNYIAGNFDAAHDARMSAVGAAGEMPTWRPTVPVGEPTRSSAKQPDREFARSVFYNEIVRPRGMFYGMVAALLRSPQLDAYLTVGRSLGYEDFDADDVSAVRILVPHFLAAMQIQNRIGAADLRAADGFAVLDQLEIGVILVDEGMKPVMVNARANSILSQRDGLRIQKDGIAAALPGETRLLRRALTAAIDLFSRSPGLNAVINQGPTSYMLVSRPSPQLPLRVRVMPIAPLNDWAGARARAGVFVTEPDSAREPEVIQRSLRARFRLTPAEAAFAVEIIKGDGKKAAAQRRGIAVGTARSHLSSIFAKTGVRRQAELVRLLMECSNIDSA
jgi:DNA-binding CsgD family transcriptional regulator